MEKKDLQEKLVALYLRLNGYFTTGLILHSKNDTQVNGEIDIVGVRFKGHKQIKREIESSSLLRIPTTSIDIIIGEVKGGHYQLQFNDSLKHNTDSIKELFDWIGCIDYDDDLINNFKELITPKKIQNSDEFMSIINNNTSIRPIVFAPDRPLPKNNQIRYIHGKELIDYCWNCLRPKEVRPNCSTNYIAINNWGEQFESLIGYFKNHDKKDAGSMKDLYEHFNLE
jgi:hypothetical protein